MGDIVPFTKQGGAMHSNSWQNIPAKSSWKKRKLLFMGYRVHCDAAFCGVVKPQIAWVSS